MKTLFVILVLSSILISCKNDSHTNSIPVAKSKTELINKDTFFIDFQCKEISASNFESQLYANLVKLSTLDNNYQITKSGESKLEESIVLNGFEKLAEVGFKIKNLQILKENIAQINYGYIKGTKDLGSKTYARAKVEELIFRSEECASILTNFINQIKNNARSWNEWYEIDKSPSSIFRQKNKVYYISTGGWYMEPFYEEIKHKMKK